MVSTRLVNDLHSALEELRRERDELDEKIGLMEDALARLDQGTPTKTRRKAGRKKAATKRKAGKKRTTARTKRKTKRVVKTAAKRKTARKKKKPNWSAEARAAAAERMRKYWADRRKKRG